MKTKEFYINEYEVFWEKCIKEATDFFIENDIDFESDNIRYEATMIFEETVKTNAVVGYYLSWYEEDAYKQWKVNTDGIVFNKQDKEVDKILKVLLDK